MTEKTPLSQFPFFHSSRVEEAEDAIGRVYCDVKLAPTHSRRPFDLQFYVAPVGQVTLTVMKWKSGIDAAVPMLDGCFDFSSVLSGGAETSIGGEIVDHNPSCAVVMSPNRPMALRAAEGSTSFNAKVRRDSLESHLQAISGVEVKEPLEFNPAMPMEGANQAVWNLIRLMANELDRDASLLAYPLVAERFSETVFTAILHAQANNYSKVLTGAVSLPGPIYVRRAEEYIEAHCAEPMTAELLSNVVGVSLRTLYTGFRKHREYTPMAFLRTVRLQRVRTALLAAPPGTSVSEIAFRYGFSHLGRFSAIYRRQFGESPSETLRRRL